MMDIFLQGLDLKSLPGPLPAFRAPAGRDQWRRLCAQVHEADGRLAALWATDARPDGQGFLVHAVLTLVDSWLWLTYSAGDEQPSYPAIDDIFPSAARPQRAIYDLLGIACGGADARPWLRHGAWSPTEFPLRHDFDTPAMPPDRESGYPFIAVAGNGVHEIGVGPIHAGTIEPGHFRFHVVGDEILRLEERLGYTHKGVEKRFGSLTLPQGTRLAARICADSTVAYTWAYAMAAETLCGCHVPHRAQWLRGLLLERERIANHLGDIGALSNDAGLAFGQTQFSLLKERWIQANHRVFGHRYLMDTIVLGGVAHDLGPEGQGQMREECDTLEMAVHTLQDIIDDHAGLQERFIETGRVTMAQARALGAVGLIARASGLARDMRTEFPYLPYTALSTRAITRSQGDVAARVVLRFSEIYESLRLIRDILANFPDGPLLGDCDTDNGTAGLGCVEGWRGEVLVGIERIASGHTHRVHIHDPSWQNWPLLEHAVIGDLVPDFPLINKSFNLAYSGHDL
ncbi:MAG TPA: NADH-quinone oxidoreductase subunit C [Acidiferrobacter sp.]|nr:NADH-quinone oxidoreductase subunit C [Acidiferrobacter sp.]